jgi:hypothetical protein
MYVAIKGQHIGITAEMERFLNMNCVDIKYPGFDTELRLLSGGTG